jgi:hypothetical protein
LENGVGERVENVEQGEPIFFHLIVEAYHALEAPVFDFRVLNVDGVPIFGFGKTLEEVRPDAERLAAGERLRVEARIENPLVPGRYAVNCSIHRNRTPGDTALRDVRLLDFLVRGTTPDPGMVAVREELELVVE